MKDWKWIIGGTILSTILAIVFIWMVDTVSTEIDDTLRRIEHQGLKNILDEMELDRYWYGTDSSEVKDDTE